MRWRGAPSRLALLLAIATTALCAQLAESLKILELDALSLPNAIEKHKKLLLVEFYSPDCNHCKLLEPVLEEAADELVGTASIVKIDSRNAHDLNQKYSVRQTPTLVLFHKGREVTSARADLQGYRSRDSLVPFVTGFKGPAVKKLKQPRDLSKVVEARGLAVCGLFPSGDPMSASFAAIAEGMRGHVPFAAVEGNASRAQAIADAYGIDEVPSIFVTKKWNHTVQFSGDYENFTQVETFVKENSFPLVGNLSVLTYYRYQQRDTDRVYLFYDSGQDSGETDSARASLEKIAKDHDDLSFITVSSVATESDRTTIMQDKGLSEFALPALAVVSKDSPLSVAHSQMVSLSQESMSAAIEAFMKLKSDDARHPVCLGDASAEGDGGWVGEGEDQEEVLGRYELFAQVQKNYWGLDETLIREVNEDSYRRALKRSWKDVLFVYTARWCAHALGLERVLESLVKSGDLAHLEEELAIVKVDVVLTEGQSERRGGRRGRHLPAMKYVSARYKDFPYWFGGNAHSKKDVLDFIHTYHSMRHVEIPGEGPSPFSKKRDVMGQVVSALGAGRGDEDEL